ncbi:hypothetical protein [Actinoplanes sp. NPDC026619]|uniref:hypothetical protein n=1 Tax=Actinoplanes sp. NPDC026619 TaxID=3155798 RepID=UPI0033F8BD03
MQYIDVRDLAAWLVRTNTTGTFNAVTPTMPMSALMDACAAATEPRELIWVPTAELLAAGVDHWMGVPLWIGDPEWSAANLIDASAAHTAGLTIRPLIDTVRDVTAWDTERGGPTDGQEPLSPDDEHLLLTKTGQLPL